MRDSALRFSTREHLRDGGESVDETRNRAGIDSLRSAIFRVMKKGIAPDYRDVAPAASMDHLRLAARNRAARVPPVAAQRDRGHGTAQHSLEFIIGSLQGVAGVQSLEQIGSAKNCG
jgi:isocitrate lyase